MKLLLKLIVAVVLAIASVTSAQASLTTDLQGLVTQAAALRSSLSAISVNQGGTCTELGALNRSIEDYLTSIQVVTGQISSPLTLTVEDLTALADLSGIAQNLASDSVRLSLELRILDGDVNLFEYRAALSAMLRLSADIGSMADRILEMADRILVMADNIGLMADRILATQQLQNANIALTQGSLLVTQQNMIALSGSLASIGYNLSLGLLLSDTNLQLNEMAGITLTSSNLATQLGYLQTKTAALLTRTVGIYSLISSDSQRLSHYINGDTLTLISDLSVAQRTFAALLEQYAATINQLAPLTQTPVLADATRSMLQLTADINTMSRRILEMNDKITVMADNIGLMADRIVETQNLQQVNIELTQSSILTAQATTLAVITTYVGQ